MLSVSEAVFRRSAAHPQDQIYNLWKHLQLNYLTQG